jgi:hypothetical protein
MLNRWTGEGTSNTVPRVTSDDRNLNVRNCDRWIEDASYTRIKNVQLSYNLPKFIIQTAKMEKCQLYVSVQNLKTFTKYSGLDPEVAQSNRDWGGGSLDIGVDRGNYPQARTILFGLNLTF